MLMLVQVYGDNALKKTAVYKWVKLLLKEEKVSLKKRDQDGQQQAELKKTAVYKWVKRFSEGRESVTEKERSGRPATSRI